VRINVAVPEAHVSAPILDAALEATTRLNEALIKAGEVPPFDAVRDGIRWKPEPPGDEHFDHAGVVLGRKWGDCDDMAPYAAASMRASGEDPGAIAVVKKSGPKRWHAVVQRSDGTIRDPSRETGMGQHVHGVHGAGLPLMAYPNVSEVGSYLMRPQLALRPIRDRAGQVEAWQARTDLPWHWLPGTSPTDIAMVSLHQSPSSSQAVVGACLGLAELGHANEVDDDILDRFDAIADACEGADWYDLADMYGEEHATAAGQVVGSFFGGLMKVAKTAVNPFNAAAKAAKFIPGVGPTLSRGMSSFMPTTENILKYGPSAARIMPGVGPVAAQAFEMASPYLQRTLLEQRHLPAPGTPEAYQAAQCPPGCIPLAQLRSMFG
jgi:hypothetical protein